MNVTVRRALAACLLVLTLAASAGCTLNDTYPDMSACHEEKGEVVC